MFDKGAHIVRPTAQRHAAFRRALGARRTAFDGGGAQARAFQPAALNLVAHHHLDPLAQGAGGMDAGEAGVEQHLGVVGRGQQLFFRRQLQLRDEPVDGGGPAEVAMTFDQARHQGVAAAVDDLCAIAAKLAGRSDLGNAVALDQHLAGE